MPLPTFLIAGAQKAGTTTLHQLFRKHRQIHMALGKELHFFDRHWENGVDWYASLFTPRPQHRQSGEASPTYMYDPQARERMIKTLPDIRIITILRDPTKRAYSHYWHSRRRGGEKLDTFEDAIAREPERLHSDNVQVRARYSYVDRGHYIDQLEALEAAYGRDQLHVMLLEDLIADGETALTGVFGFLGVQTRYAGRKKPQRENAYRESPGKQSVAPAAEAPAAAYPPMAPETRERLTAHYRPYNERLATWLGRDLSHWGGPTAASY